MKTDIFNTFCYLSPKKTKNINFPNSQIKEIFLETGIFKKRKIHKKKKFDLQSIKKSLNFDNLSKNIIFKKNGQRKNLKRIFFSKKEKIMKMNKLR